MERFKRWFGRELQEWKHPSRVPIAETPGGKLVVQVLRSARKPPRPELWSGPATIDSPVDGAGSAAYN